MSNDYSAIKNKQQKHSKTFFEQYLFNPGEPLGDMSSDIPPELEAELLENRFAMRRKFRHIAQRIRNRQI